MLALTCTCTLCDTTYVVGMYNRPGFEHGMNVHACIYMYCHCIYDVQSIELVPTLCTKCKSCFALGVWSSWIDYSYVCQGHSPRC